MCIADVGTSRGGDPQVNKFGQVSSPGHDMYQLEGGLGPSCTVRSHVYGWGWGQGQAQGQGGGSMYGEVLCMGNCHMGPPPCTE